MLTLGNKLTLNSQPIYHFVNKYSIDFDGVDDRIITDGADTVAQPTTYSFWCKSSTTTANYGVFGHGDFDKGAFRFNHSNTRPLLYLGINYRIIWQDTPAQDDGEWHHWVVYADTNDITNSKLYVDGVLQPVYTTTLSGSLSAYTESLTIGSNRQVGGNSFEGQIDEFAVYDRELTQDEITRMYNTYYSPNRVANGNFSQIGNEEVTNGDFSQEGSEQVTNGDFATDSDWSKGSGWTISGGSANSDGVSGASPIYQNIGAATVGTNYKIQLDVSNYTSGTLVAAYGGTSATSITSNGSYTFYVKATSTDANTSYLSYNFIGSIDNVSVKEVGQDWTFVGEWTMGDDVATNTRNAAGFDPLSSSATIVVGKQYKFKVNIISKTGGTLLLHNDWTDNNYFSTSGTGEQVWYFTATSTTIGLEFAGDGETIVVDNVSVKEVGQHWTFGTGWSMGDGVAIHDGSGGATTLQATGLSAVAGSTYQISYSATNLSGGYIKVTFGNVDTALQFSDVDFVGSITTTGSGGLYVLASANVTFDNLVVQELKHDATNLMLNAGAYQSANPLITSTKSMEFDGTDDYLQLSEPFSHTNHTICAWVNSDDFSSTQTIFDSRDANGDGIFITIETTGKIRYKINFSQNDSATILNINKWNNIVCSYNGTNLLIYINGILDNSVTSVTTVSTSTDSTIGKTSYTSGSYFDGKITEVGAYNRALTSLEVASLYNQGMPTNLLVNRNNYQSGNPTVFNTKQVDFDGTDDYLDCGTDNSLNPSTTITLSAWVKPDSLADYQYIINRCQTHNGAYRFEIAQDVLYVAFGNNTTHIDAEGNHNMIVGNWYHIVATYNGSTIKLYVNNIEIASTSGAITMYQDTGVSTLIGSPNSLGGGLFFDGDISQVGIWNSALTADEVSSLYNHGLPIDLTTDQAAYESSSNLVGYWRMGSGTLDTYPLIADQTNATLGSELVSCGNFECANPDGVWNTSTGWDVSGGTATYDGSGGTSAISQSIANIQLGRLCKVTIDVLSNQGSGANTIFLGGTVLNSNHLDVGSYTFYGSFTTNAGLYIYGRSGEVFEIDNVSVKEVGGNPAIMTNQTSSDIENGSPYANIVTNGDFELNSDWTFSDSNSTSIANGTLNVNGTQSGTVWAYQSGVTSGKQYKFVYTVTSLTSGEVRAGLSGVNGTWRNSTGTYTEYLTPTSGTIYLYFNSDFVGSIDNVSVSEVNTGLQGYWKMGDGTNDEYPVIYDQTNPTNGSELVTNGDFSNGTTDWTNQLSANFSVTNGVATIESTGANSLINQNISPSSVNAILKIEIDVVSFTGDKLQVLFAGSTTNINKLGISTYYTSPNRSNNKMDISPTTGHTIVIRSISAKEVQGNPATMTNMVEGNITNQYPLTKIRNYYRMGDGILDGYPIIQDQTSPNLAHIPTTNLYDFSEDFSSWSYLPRYSLSYGFLSPDGTNNATKLTAANPDPYIFKNITGATALTYSASIYIKGTTSTIGEDARLWIIRDNVDFPFQDFTITGEWQRIKFTTSFGTTPTSFVYLRLDAPNTNVQVGDEVFIFGAQLEEQSQATAYIKSDGIAAVRKATTTNLITYSEDFSQAIYLKSNVTLESGFVSPFGTSTAKKLIEGTNNGSHFIYANVFLSGLRFFSVYLKKAERDYAWITDSQNGNGININLTNGTFTSINNPINPKIENVGNDWYRCSFGSNVSSVWQLRIDTAIDSGRDYQGDGTSGIYIFGTQLEEQTQAETYAPTYGLPVEIDLFTENNYGTMTNMSASDIIEDTPNN